MLPFLKNRNVPPPIADPDNQGSTAVKRKPDQEEDLDLLEQAAKEFLSAVSAKDAKALAAAFKACCDIVDSQPHVEGPHLG